MRTLAEFLAGLDAAAASGVVEPRCPAGTRARGGGSGPGPHYGVPGTEDEMLSPSREELAVLFCLARVWRPEVAVEYGTGTGLSAAALALGWPEAKVVTADRFSVLDCERTARAVWRGFGVDGRVRLERGEWGAVPALARAERWRVGVLFADGASEYPWVPGFPGARPDCLYAAHDFGGFTGALPGAWAVDTSSVLGLWAADPEVADRALTTAALVVPWARCGRVAREGE